MYYITLFWDPVLDDAITVTEIVNPVGLVGLQYHYIHTKFHENLPAGRISLVLFNGHTHIYMHVGKEPSLHVVAALVLLRASNHVGNVTMETGIMCSRKDVTWYIHEIVFLYMRTPASVGNTFQDLPRLCETADNTERYI